MTRSLVIVESPAKAKTIMNYLGKDYTVLASYGHIRDLPSKTGSVNPDEDFSMLWQLSTRGKKQLKSIAAAAKGIENLYLATDPDREGEAISWHVLEALKEEKKLSKINIKRVVFHEITKPAVQEAIKNPRELDFRLIDAYLARRALDYLVGFTLSPLLWRRLPGAKSAGRVQSVALRLIVQREEEIEKFNPQEYWSIQGLFDKQTKFYAKLNTLENQKIEKFSFQNQQDSELAKEILSQNLSYNVDNIVKKIVKRNPTAPFITSTLQQEASRKLNFSASKTMTIAQKLYEGIKIKDETKGLITYMRTDSTNLSKLATTEIRNFLEENMGKGYVPNEPRIYKKKVKNAQEAHEAIRPTSIFLEPKNIAKYLDEDQLKLYEIIWKRTLASQMESALFDQLSFFLKNENAIFSATGKTLKFDGFLKVYQEGQDDGDEEKSVILPQLTNGETVALHEIITKQHFTQPPPRYSEASLVKTLEEKGIGRPSTYATLLQILQDRKYVKLEQKKFFPENSGRLVTAYLERYCKKYVEYDFTANMEESLDLISSGEEKWKAVLKNFWIDFQAQIKQASEFRIAQVIDQLEEDLNDFLFSSNKERICPTCKIGKTGLRLGRFGSFVGCSRYPECNFTQPLSGDANDTIPRAENIELGIDPIDNVMVSLKSGPYGQYFEWDFEKKKRISVPQSIQDNELTFDLAMTLKELPKEIGENPENKEKIKIAIGRFGPYIICGKENVAGILGFISGLITVWISLKFKVLNILSGVLVMTALYSVNYRIMNGPQIPFFHYSSVFLKDNAEFGNFIILLMILLGVVFFLLYFLKTNFGLALIASGHNPKMAKANGINVNKMSFIGLGISNSIVGIAGSLWAQFHFFSDISSGNEMLVNGLAGLIIGEILFQKSGLFNALIACVIGALVHDVIRFLSFNFNFLSTTDTNLITVLIIVGAIGFNQIKKRV